MGSSLIALAKSIYNFKVCLIINGKRGNPHYDFNLTTSKFGDCGMEIPEAWMPTIRQNRNIAGG